MVEVKKDGIQDAQEQWKRWENAIQKIETHVADKENPHGTSVAQIGAAFKQPQRNLVINGAMNVWQRGTSFERQMGKGDTAYTADGCLTITLGNANIIISKETTDLPEGFTSAVKVSVTDLQPKPGEEHIINRVFCDNPAPGVYTASCMAKGPAGSSCAFAFDTAVKIHTFSGQWERVSITKRMETSNVYNFDILRNPQPVGDYCVTGVKIEAGERYTGWDYENPVEESARCYRRFVRLRPQGEYMYLAGSAAERSDAVYATLYPPVPMRTLPTLKRSGNYALRNGESTIPITDVIANFNTSITTKIGCVGIGLKCLAQALTVGTYYALGVIADSNAYMDLDADIY